MLISSSKNTQRQADALLNSPVSFLVSPFGFHAARGVWLRGKRPERGISEAVRGGVRPAKRTLDRKAPRASVCHGERSPAANTCIKGNARKTGWPVP